MLATFAKMRALKNAEDAVRGTLTTGNATPSADSADAQAAALLDAARKFDQAGAALRQDAAVATYAAELEVQKQHLAVFTDAARLVNALRARPSAEAGPGVVDVARAVAECRQLAQVRAMTVETERAARPATADTREPVKSPQTPAPGRHL